MTAAELSIKLRSLEHDLAEAKRSANSIWQIQLWQEIWLARQALLRLRGVFGQAQAFVAALEDVEVAAGAGSRSRPA